MRQVGTWSLRQDDVLGRDEAAERGLRTESWPSLQSSKPWPFPETVMVDKRYKSLSIVNPGSFCSWLMIALQSKADRKGLCQILQMVLSSRFRSIAIRAAGSHSLSIR